MARKLPQNIEAEQALLGTTIVYPDTMKGTYDSGLLAKDFFLERNRQIYEALVALYREKKAIDFVSLLARLEDLQQIEQIGGVDYLSSLTDMAVSAYNTQHYIDLIRDKALMRELINVAQEITTKSFEDSYKSNDVLDEAERLILQTSRSRQTSEFRQLPDVVDDVMDRAKELMKTGGKPTGVKTNFVILDQVTHGLQKNDLIIIAARPSIGKTAFALNLAVNGATNSKLPVAFFSLEMAAESLVTRMLALKSKVDGSKIQSGDIKAAMDQMALNNASMQLRRLPIYIDDSPLIKISEIAAKCRKLQNEKGLALIVVDYLQLVSARDVKRDNRQQEVSEISRDLKALARELRVPVIALSQLSRDIEKRSEGRSKKKTKPRLSDLRESGSIEQDADIVIFLSRKEESEEEAVKKDDNGGVIVVDIAKHRNGRTTEFELYFTKNIGEFANLGNKTVTKAEVTDE